MPTARLVEPSQDIMQSSWAEFMFEISKYNGGSCSERRPVLANFESLTVTWGVFCPLWARYTLSFSTIVATFWLHKSGPEFISSLAWFQKTLGDKPLAQLSSSSPAPGIYFQLNSEVVLFWKMPVEEDADTSIMGVKSQESQSGTSFNQMTVFWEIHRGRKGFFKDNARDAISAPLASNSLVHSSKQSSMAAFSVFETHSGRCKEQSQSWEICLVFSPFLL